MKRIVWPLLHRYKLNCKANINKHPWGWISQEEVIKLSNSKIQKTETNSFLYNLEERLYFEENSFKSGVKIGYNTIKKSFYKKENFLENYYLTPKLSLAINDINYFIIKKNIQNEMVPTTINEVEILGSWVEVGLTKTNNKILGLWDKEFIKNELLIGGIGPEIRHLWDQKPIKQTVRVLYKLENRIDIFDWERCLITDNYEWTVSNINNVIY